MIGEVVMAFTMQGGRKLIPVTSLTLVNNTAFTLDTIVPAGKRWILLNIKVINIDDVNRAVTFFHFKEAAKTNRIKLLHYQGALGALGYMNWPADIVASVYITYKPYAGYAIFDEGECISIEWAAGGASAGGTDADGIVFEYLEMDM